MISGIRFSAAEAQPIRMVRPRDESLVQIGIDEYHQLVPEGNRTPAKVAELLTKIGQLKDMILTLAVEDEMRTIREVSKYPGGHPAYDALGMGPASAMGFRRALEALKDRVNAGTFSETTVDALKAEAGWTEFSQYTAALLGGNSTFCNHIDTFLAQTGTDTTA